MVPTAQIFAKGLHENGWSAVDWHHRHVKRQCIYYLSQCCNLLMRFGAVAIQRCHTNSPEDVYVSVAKKHPHFVAVFLELHATAPVRLCSIDAAREKSRIHPIQHDGLKQAQNWMHTGHVENTAQMEILTKTSSSNHLTSTLTRTADRVNCAQRWYTSS